MEPIAIDYQHSGSHSAGKLLPLCKNLKNYAMVTIVDVAKTIKKDGSTMISIVVQGGMEPVVSNTSGRVYMTARKTRIPCTFTYEAAKAMIGQTMPGTIRRVECEPYSVVIPGTGKKVKLNHTYVYDPNPVSVEEVVG